MSRQHVPEQLLQQFVEGEVEEKVAVAIALHLDACPACSTRAAALEPLAPVFAAMDDPEIPVGLVESIAVAVREDARPGPELMVSAALLGLAILMLALGGAPTELVTSGVALFSATMTVAAAVLGQSSILVPIWLAAAAVALGAAVVFARSLEQRRMA